MQSWLSQTNFTNFIPYCPSTNQLCNNRYRVKVTFFSFPNYNFQHCLKQFANNLQTDCKYFFKKHPHIINYHHHHCILNLTVRQTCLNTQQSLLLWSTFQDKTLLPPPLLNCLLKQWNEAITDNDNASSSSSSQLTFPPTENLIIMSKIVFKLSLCTTSPTFQQPDKGRICCFLMNETGDRS